MRYQYDCEDCMKEFEVDIKLKDYGMEVKCPKCGKPMILLLAPTPFRMN